MLGSSQGSEKGEPPGPMMQMVRVWLLPLSSERMQALIRSRLSAPLSLWVFHSGWSGHCPGNVLLPLALRIVKPDSTAHLAMPFIAQPRAVGEALSQFSHSPLMTQPVEVIVEF